ncbi:hypothetical protein [Streptomyces sp. NPDC003247]|uniref:hypothetical protein n=1 Tax=Streptomyces sp. NPDC003247 TaxID=3364677 RepID=UPI0036CBBC9D
MTQANGPAPPRATLVVTAAPAGDVVGRAGGAIAPAAAREETVTFACPTSGERGESAEAWREGGEPDGIKVIRRDGAERAAAPLGARAQRQPWDHHTGLAARRGVRLEHHAGPHRGPAHQTQTMTEAHARPHSQIVEEPA